MGGSRPPSWESIHETVTRPRPISLSKDELGADELAQPADEPIEVKAWVRFPETPIRVSGRAIAWTKRAVWIEFTMKSGITHRVWVWASAVERKQGEQPR